MLKQISSLGTTLNKKDLESIKGGREVYYLPAGDGNCAKVVRDNDGNLIKFKVRDRYAGRC